MTATRTGRAILITGSSGEIGAHLAGHFVDAGWTVLGIDRQPPRAPSALVFRQADLSDGAQAAAAIDALTATHGVCDVVVNCAGYIANAPLVRLEDGQWVPHDFALWDRVIGANLGTAFHVCATAAKHMATARRRGVIVNFSSVCARGTAGQAAYSAAKAGVEGLTRALAKELGPLGIRVVAVAPGYFDTASMHANVPPARLTKVVAAVPLRRLGALREIATAIDFIVANEYVNGTVVEVNGGLVV